jgi:phosphopantetheinyl transferase (holo-ACP synthase)
LADATIVQRYDFGKVKTKKASRVAVKMEDKTPAEVATESEIKAQSIATYFSYGEAVYKKIDHLLRMQDLYHKHDLNPSLVEDLEDFTRNFEMNHHSAYEAPTQSHWCALRRLLKAPK